MVPLTFKMDASQLAITHSIPTKIHYVKNPNGTYAVQYSTSRTKGSSTRQPIEYAFPHTLSFDELRATFGDVVAGKMLGGHGEPTQGYLGKSGFRTIEPTTYDFRSKFGPNAGINPQVMRGLAGSGIGATIGYQIGDTPEEKKRNAILGALIGGGSALGGEIHGVLSKSTNPAHSELAARMSDLNAKG